MASNYEPPRKILIIRITYRQSLSALVFLQENRDNRKRGKMNKRKIIRELENNLEIVGNISENWNEIREECYNSNFEGAEEVRIFRCVSSL